MGATSKKYFRCFRVYVLTELQEIKTFKLQDLAKALVSSFIIRQLKLTAMKSYSIALLLQLF